MQCLFLLGGNHSKVKVAQSCPILCHPIDYAVHGILQATVLGWIAFPFSRGSSQPKDQTQISHSGGRFFTVWATESESEVAQSCLNLCDPVDCSLPGFSVHGILQARILEWVTISFSRGSFRPRGQTQVSRIGGRCFNLWANREAP